MRLLLIVIVNRIEDVKETLRVFTQDLQVILSHIVLFLCITLTLDGESLLWTFFLKKIKFFFNEYVFPYKYTDDGRGCQTVIHSDPQVRVTVI